MKSFGAIVTVLHLPLVLCYVTFAATTQTTVTAINVIDEASLEGCIDPKQTVLDLLQCVGNQNADCAAEMYDPNFERYHNDILTNQHNVKDPSFWKGVFTFFPLFAFDIKHIYTINSTTVNLRYIEKVTSTNGSNIGLYNAPYTFYPFQQSVDQYEDAIITVHYYNNTCQVRKWEQYGDNQEQSDVDAIASTLFLLLGVTTTIALMVVVFLIMLLVRMVRRSLIIKQITTTNSKKPKTE